MYRVLQQRLAHISASTSATSAMLDEDIGIGSQSTSSFGRDAEIREVRCLNSQRHCRKALYVVVRLLLQSAFVLLKLYASGCMRQLAWSF
jgi:hypothetical protein